MHVFGIGQASLDVIGTIEAYPPPDVKCEFQGAVLEGGGPVATALVALSRWGKKCALAGVAGDDPFGVMIRDSLKKEGIDLAGLLIRPGTSSQFAFIAAEPETGRRTIFWQRPSGKPLGPGEIRPDTLKRAKIIHTDGLFPEASLAACREAVKRGVPTVVDAGTWREGMADIARCSDFLIASESCGKAISGSDSPLDACRRILEYGPRLAVVTLGARGYVAAFEGRTIRVPAYPVKAVDTTGCGDVFHAGFIYGLLRKWDFEKSLDFGSWAASRVSLRLGGRAGIPGLAEVRKKLAGFG